MDKHRNVGTHAEDVDGRLVAPGEEVNLSAEQLKDTNIAQLVEDEKLIPIPAAKEKAKS